MKKLLIVGCSILMANLVQAQSIFLPVGSGPFAVQVSQDSTQAFVVNRSTNSVSFINLADNTVTKTIAVGTGPTSIAINPVTNKAVVTNFGSDNVSIIDIASGTVTATVDVGPKSSDTNFHYSPRDVVIDTTNNVAIIANLNGRSVSLINLNSNTQVLTTPIQVGANPISVVYYPPKNVTLVANYQDNTVTVIDMQNKARLRDISVGISPADIALDVQTKRAIVVNENTNDITILDMDKITTLSQSPIVTTVAVGTRPLGAVINPNTNVAAILTNGNKSISLVNLSDNTKYTTVISGVGDTPSHIALNPANNSALVASPANDGIYVVRLGFINYLPFSLDTDIYRTNLAITNISSVEANVQVELWDKDGKRLASGTTKVPTKGLKQINNVNRYLLAAGQVTNTIGYLRVTSDQPFSSFISVIDNSSNDPALQVGRTTGFPRLVIDSATNTGAFRSRLAILNLGNTRAAVKLTARSNDTGAVIATKDGVFIELNGFYFSNDVFTEMGVQNNFGPLEIESANLQPLLAVTLVESTNRTSGFLEAVPIQ